MGVCLQKERENSLIMEGIKPTRDLRRPWRCTSVKIVSVSFSLSRSLASHNNVSFWIPLWEKKLTNQPCPFSDENYENSYLFPLLDRVFNFFECLKSFGVSIQMKATKFFGMELFAFRQFSKTKTWRFCWTSWLLGTARNQRLRPQRLIDYYLHSYLCVTLRSVFLWFC